MAKFNIRRKRIERVVLTGSGGADVLEAMRTYCLRNGYTVTYTSYPCKDMKLDMNRPRIVAERLIDVEDKDATAIEE